MAKDRKQTPLISMLEDIIRETVDLRTPEVIRKEIGAALDAHRGEITQTIDAYLEKRLGEAVSFCVVSELDKQLGLEARRHVQQAPAQAPDGPRAETLESGRKAKAGGKKPKCEKCGSSLNSDGSHRGGKKCKAKA